MKAIGVLIFALAFFVPGPGRAQVQPLGPGIPTVEGMIKEFRDKLRTKLEELQQNYQFRFADNSVVYRSNLKVYCSGHGSSVPGDTVAKIEYSYESRPDSLTEIVRYYTCHTELVFTEIFQSEGKNLTPSRLQDIVSGQKALGLQAGETSKAYSATDASDKQVFRVFQSLKDGEYRAHIFVDQQEGISYIQETQPTYVEGRYRITKNNFSYSQAGHSINRTFSNHDPRPLTARISKNGDFEYTTGLSSDKVAFSQFASYFVSNGIQGPIESINKVMKGWLDEMPPTAFVTAGEVTSLLLDELKLILKRLTTGEGTEEIKHMIFDLIQAVKDGLIVDKRPPK